MAITRFILLAVLLHVVSSKHFVTNVRQNYADAINDRLIQQIQVELSAGYIYQGYASYFQRANVNLPGISKFFSDASLEELDHAQTLIDYVNKRGGFVKFDTINFIDFCTNASKEEARKLTGSNNRTMCICGFVSTKTINSKCGPRQQWQEGLMAFEDALAMERYVNTHLLEIHKEAENENDNHLAHILEHEFLEEQVNSIFKLAHYVTRLRSFANGNNYKLGEYILDQHIV